MCKDNYLWQINPPLPMISVCIPVYNADVRKLARTLKEQAADISAEIILIDDGSGTRYREMNRPLKEEGILYHELEKNIGRSRIRNRFTGVAGKTHLLYLDCDSEILSDYFLSNYFEAMREYPGKVICGGRSYGPKPREKEYRLHWKYGIMKESRPVEIRNADPNHSFMTNNFLIPLKILKELPFNEKLSGYGHEDSLFGYELGLKGHEIVHIDNPVRHGKLETNREFVSKTSEAVQSLVQITDMRKGDPGFAGSITLLQTANRLTERGLADPLRIMARLTNPLARRLLGMGWNKLWLLDAYKLGLYLQLKKQSQRDSVL